MFFGRAFELAHDCMEDLLVEAGFGWKDWFANSHYAMPIRQAQADYRRPIPAGQLYEIEAVVKRIGDTSVSFQFTFRVENQVALVLDSTHVLLDVNQKMPTAWPADFRAKLAAYTQTEGSPQ